MVFRQSVNSFIHMQTGSYYNIKTTYGDEDRDTLCLCTALQGSTGCYENHTVRTGHCFLACSGINLAKVSAGRPFNSIHTRQLFEMESSRNEEFNKTWECLPCGLKLNNGGRNLPLGSRVFGSRSSSKKGCIMASSCSAC